MEKYEEVLKLMQSKPDGRIDVTDPDLLQLLGEKLASYRIPHYMSNIRNKANLEVKGIRIKRKVVAYQLVAAAPATTNGIQAPPAPSVPVIPPAVDSPSPEPTSEEPGTAQPTAVSTEPSSNAPETSSEGWSI